MLKKTSFLLSCLLLGASLYLTAQEDENNNLSLTLKETPILKEIAPIPQPSFEAFAGAITGTKVRMRTQPTLDAHVVRETVDGEMFAVIGETCGYYAITPPKGTKGYVFRTFILDGMVEGERVNVRLYPDIDAPVIGQLNHGDFVTSVISDTNNKW